MAVWSLKPTWKKSLVEREHWRNDKGEQLVHEIGWRWGEFIVTTECDKEPYITAGDNLWDCGYDVEMVEMTDGCWEQNDYDDCSTETQEWLETFLEENSVFDLEEHGWTLSESECIIDCDPEFEMLEPTEDAIGTEPPKDESQKGWPYTG